MIEKIIVDGIVYGCKRDLGDGKTLFLYERMFNNLLALGKTDDLTGYDDGY